MANGDQTINHLSNSVYTSNIVVFIMHYCYCMLLLHAFFALLYFYNVSSYSAIQPQVCNKLSVQCSKWLLNELAGVILTLIHSNISDQLPKLYLFHSLNTTMCGGDINPYSVSGAKSQPPNVFLDII